MASRYEDWVSLEGLKKAIRAPHADEVKLAAHIRAAVDWTSRSLRLPLIDRQRRIRRRAPAPQYPLRITNEPHLLLGMAVPRVRWWDEDPPVGEPTVLAEATQQARTVGTLLSQEESGDGDEGDWLLYPPAGGWPAQAQWLEVTLNVGLYPAQHPTLREVVENTARDLWMGKVGMDEARLTDRMMAAYAPEVGYLPVQVQESEEEGE